MPRPRTGTFEPPTAPGRPFRGRLRLADGARTDRFDLPADMNERQARAYLAGLQAEEDRTHAVFNAKQDRARELAEARGEAVEGETCTAYFKRHTAAREADGVRDTRKERTIWGKWLAPRIGPRPVVAVTRDEVEVIRDLLDDHVRQRIKVGLAAGISGDTAANVWSVLRTMFKEAVGSRDRSLRVRTDDPTAGHKAPLTTPPRRKTFLYPVEVTKLLACREVPREWREAYAVAMYLYVRPEELQALTWRDVDFTAGTVSVSKAIEARSGKPKALPKTQGAVRDVPIEPTLRPLLKRLHKGRAGDDAYVLPVLWTLNDKFRAKQLREHLRLADVTRDRLFAETATLLPINFRSCRDSGITWLALAGVPLQAMKSRAGHEDVETTLGYVKMAEDLGGKVGTPFPPLPADLLGRRMDQRLDQLGRQPAKLLRDSVPEEGIEPPT